MDGGVAARVKGPPSALTNAFRKEGEYWTISYSGKTVRIRDAIGVHYLAHLLVHPHERFAVSDLRATVTGDGATDPERARSAVSKRIKSAIDRIALHHPALGYHLLTTIKTGSVCVYQAHPEHPLLWTV